MLSDQEDWTVPRGAPLHPESRVGVTERVQVIPRSPSFSHIVATVASTSYAIQWLASIHTEDKVVSRVLDDRISPKCCTSPRQVERFGRSFAT